MKSRFVAVSVAAICTLLALASTARAADDPAVAVARLMEPQRVVGAAFLQTIPAGTMRDYAERELAAHPALWAAVEQELATVLREAFSPAQLVELRNFLESPTGRAWAQAAPTLYLLSHDSARTSAGSQFQLASIGCVIGLMAPNVEAAKAKAGRTEPGMPAEMFAAAAPLREGAKETCDCILAKSLEHWPQASVTDLQRQPGYRELAGELLESGACSLPTPPAPPEGGAAKPG